jgi:hypothetical protein
MDDYDVLLVLIPAGSRVNLKEKKYKEETDTCIRNDKGTAHHIGIYKMTQSCSDLVNIISPLPGDQLET